MIECLYNMIESLFKLNTFYVLELHTQILSLYMVLSFLNIWYAGALCLLTP